MRNVSPERFRSHRIPRGSSLRAEIAVVLAVIIWGSMYPLSQVTLTRISAIGLVWLRVMIALLVVLPWAVRTKFWHVSRYHLTVWIVTGLIGYGLSLPLLYIGLRLTSAAVASVFSCLAPVFIVLISWLRGESVTWRQGGALLLAMGGVAVIAGWPGSATLSADGIGALFGAALLWAIYTVVNQHTMTDGLVTALFWEFFGAAAALTPGAILTGHWVALRHAPLFWWVGVIYLGSVAMGLAFGLWNYGFVHLSAARGAALYFVQPLVGLGLSILLLHATFTGREYGGSGLILFSTLTAHISASTRLHAHTHSSK